MQKLDFMKCVRKATSINLLSVYVRANFLLGAEAHTPHIQRTSASVRGQSIAENLMHRCRNEIK